MAPLVSVVEKGGHCLQDDWPGIDAYVPSTQGAQTPAPGLENVPFGHGKHSLAPDFE